MKKVWIDGKHFDSQTAAAAWLGTQLSRKLRPDDIRRALLGNKEIGGYPVTGRKPEPAAKRPEAKPPPPVPGGEKRPALLRYPPGWGPLYIRNKWK